MPKSLLELLNNERLVDCPSGAKSLSNEYVELLTDLQGNVLTSHGFARTHYFLVEFEDADADPHLTRTRYFLGMLARTPRDRFRTRQEIRALYDQGLLSDAWNAVAETLAEEPDSARSRLMRDIEMLSEITAHERRLSRFARDEEDKPVAPSIQFAVNILLSHSGYEKLGYSRDDMPNCAAFREGMLERGKRLNDPPCGTWDPRYVDDGKPIQFDAMVTLSYDPSEEGRAQQTAIVEELTQVIEGHTKRCVRERGDVLRARFERKGPRPHPIEPFGFRDGISQPVFYQQDWDYLQRAGKIGEAWNPGARLNLALVPDPRGASPHSCGSLVVYRKLSQDVAKFHAQSEEIAQLQRQALDQEARRITELAAKRRAEAEEAISRQIADVPVGQDGTFAQQVAALKTQLAGHSSSATKQQQQAARLRAQHIGAPMLRAMLVGRDYDGTPLLDAAAANARLDNDFDFSSDVKAKICPAFAHIRKVNPRSDVKYGSRERRIVRHGVPYGPRIEREGSVPKLDDKGQPLYFPSDVREQAALTKQSAPDVGLLFFCAQSSIEHQFEHLQAWWANEPTHSSARGRCPAADPIVGQPVPGAAGTLDLSGVEGSTAAPRPNWNPVVSLRGGEYFFAPSISFLRRLLTDLLA